MPIRDIYLKIQTIHGYCPVAPDTHVSPPIQYGRDCMRNVNHEDGNDPRARRAGPTGQVISTPLANNTIPASLINPGSAAGVVFFNTAVALFIASSHAPARRMLALVSTSTTSFRPGSAEVAAGMIIAANRQSSIKVETVSSQEEEIVFFDTDEGSTDLGPDRPGNAEFTARAAYAMLVLCSGYEARERRARLRSRL